MIKVQELFRTFSEGKMAKAPSTTISVEFQQSEKLSELWYLSTQWIFLYYFIFFHKMSPIQPYKQALLIDTMQKYEANTKSG